MDKLVRNIEIPLAKKRIIDAGLYIVPKDRFMELSEASADAYFNYPLHNWFSNGKYDPVTAKLLMYSTIASLKDDAVIFADSEEINGFAVWVPMGFTGSKTIPFIKNGGLKLILHNGPGMIRKLLIYESFAMNLKKKYTGHIDWYLFNLSVKRDAQGMGIGKKLLGPFLQFCDDEKMVAYLETNKESNVGLYEHFGFDLRETNLVPKSTVYHYSMVRDPK